MQPDWLQSSNSTVVIFGSQAERGLTHRPGPWRFEPSICGARYIAFEVAANAPARSGLASGSGKTVLVGLEELGTSLLDCPRRHLWT